MGHDIKTIKQQFKDKGVFYTDSRLAELLKSYIPEDVTAVYDPTCGDGALLSQFPDNVVKYGQELDAEQAEAARQRLTNCVIATGDTLQEPNFIDIKFRGIVANPPFSIKWQPHLDERFDVAPCLAPQSKADYAFLLHIYHYLADNGVAAVLNFPGVLYRGNREGKIRQWLIDQNAINEVVAIEGGYFVDTKINTALIVMRKNRTSTDIKFTDHEHNLSRIVPISEVRQNGYTLSVSSYVQPPEPIKPPINPIALEMKARANAIKRIRAELNFSKMVCEFEGLGFNEFLDQIEEVINNFRN